MLGISRRVRWNPKHRSVGLPKALESDPSHLLFSPSSLISSFARGSRPPASGPPPPLLSPFSRAAGSVPQLAGLGRGHQERRKRARGRVGGKCVHVALSHPVTGRGAWWGTEGMVSPEGSVILPEAAGGPWLWRCFCSRGKCQDHEDQAMVRRVVIVCLR